MKTTIPSSQLTLPLGGGNAPDANPCASGAVSEPSNLIRFEDAVKMHRESQKSEAIRRILSLRDDVREA